MSEKILETIKIIILISLGFILGYFSTTLLN